MVKFRICRWLLVSSLALVIGSGCVYYNTFFNAKKKFNEAEDIQFKNQQAQGNSRGVNQTRGGGPGGERRAGNRQSGRTSGSSSQSLVTPQVKLLYEDAIKKASKVLKFHPESKYVDDALWLIGKSYFNMGDYLLADRKFQELVINHEESKYADDSYFYSGLCQIELGNGDLANRAFAKVESIFEKSEYIDDIYFAKGNIDKKAGSYIAAIDQFNLYIEKFPKGDSAAKAVYYVGQCREQLEENYEAYLTFSRVEEFKPDKELYFEAKLAAAVAVLKTDSLHIGMKILDDLANNERYFSHSALIRLKIAEGFYRQGETDKAMEEYTSVTVQSPRTEESAEAFYRLGLINQDDLFDIEKAKEAFNKAQNESHTSEYKNLALSKSAQIAKLESYQIELQRADSLLSAELNADADSVAVDSTIAPEDSTVEIVRDSIDIDPPPIDSLLRVYNGEALYTVTDSTGLIVDPGKEPVDDSLAYFIGPLPNSTLVFDDPTGQIIDPDGMVFDARPDSLKIDQDSLKAAEAARRDSVRQDLIRTGIETRFLLAELYAYDLKRPDSAITEYLLIVEEHPESPFAVRALLAAANIEFGRQDTLQGNAFLRRVVDEYPSSPHAVQAAEILNYPLNLSENALGLYARAESLIYYENDPQSAITIFRLIADYFPDLKAKASFAIAWTLDNIMNVTDSSAYYAYTSVKDEFPETEYAEAAKLKLGLTSRVRESQQRRRDRESEAQNDLEEPGVNQDSLDREAMGLPRAPQVITLGEFLYPEELLDKDLKGEVIFKIKLDLTGRVQDYELIGPSGERAIDSVATVALLETEFDTSNFDFTQLESFFRYSIPFERPEIDLFNDPYRERRERERY
jgi:TolA-binding protein